MSKTELAGAEHWLVEGSAATVVIWQGRAISVVPPTFVELVVSECAPNAKGDTVSGGTKSAVLETGFEIRVPLFIVQGERIRVDTSQQSMSLEFDPQSFAQFVTKIRSFMSDRRIMEVFTNPLMQARVPDIGVEALSVQTSQGRFYLHTSPEWEMKRCLRRDLVIFIK